MKKKYYLISILVFALSLCIYDTDSTPVDSAKVYRETFVAGFTKNDSINAIDSFVREVKRTLNSSKYVSSAEKSIVIYSLDRDTVVFQDNMTKVLTPASTTKLMTTFCAMSYFGPHFGITTTVYTNGKIDKTGVLHGDIIMVGRGDAILSVNDIDVLVQGLLDLGIDSITGKFLYDDSFFDSKRIRKEYSGDADHVVKLAPLSALGIERNTATLLISSGSYNNSRLNVQLIPNSEAFLLNVTGKTRGGSKSKAYYESESNDTFEKMYNIDYLGDAPPAPARVRSTVKISTSYNSTEHKQVFSVGGYLNAKRRTSYAYHMNEPAAATIGTLMQRLRTQGVGCGHDIDTINIRHSKDTLTILSEFSRSLSEYSAAINKDSDNFLAENLFKLTGALYGNYKNNAAGARSVRDSVIKQKKIFSKGISINDGSGLSRNNLLSAKSLLDILIAANKSNMRVEFDSTLSIAGVDGTLKRRMKNTAAEANLIAKTGTLRNASALAGYCTTLDGERLAFAFIFNGNDVHSYKETEDKLGALMSQFFYFHKEN